MFFKKLPTVSLALLVTAYATFGWFLATSHYSSLAWILAIAWLLLLAWALLSPLRSSAAFISRWFKSDVVAFLSLMLLAAGVAIVLFWLHIFVQALIILSAEILARVDIQTANFSEGQAFWILTITSLLGLAVGWGIYYLVYIADLPL